jgi:hypothetical protein
LSNIDNEVITLSVPNGELLESLTVSAPEGSSSLKVVSTNLSISRLLVLEQGLSLEAAENSAIIIENHVIVIFRIKNLVKDIFPTLNLGKAFSVGIPDEVQLFVNNESKVVYDAEVPHILVKGKGEEFEKKCPEWRDLAFNSINIEKSRIECVSVVVPFGRSLKDDEIETDLVLQKVAPSQSDGITRRSQTHAIIESSSNDWIIFVAIAVVILIALSAHAYCQIKRCLEKRRVKRELRGVANEGLRDTSSL